METKSVSGGLNELTSMYDGYIIDQWGVLHDGKLAYDGTISCMEKLRSLNKKIVLLSNSSKRKGKAFSGLAKVGFNEHLFDDCITSGELGWNLIVDNNIPGLDLSKGNKKVFVFGNGEDDREYIESAGCMLSSIAHANFLIARGTFAILDGENDKVYKSPESLIEDTDVLLQQALDRNLLLFITNPDIMRPGSNSPMPGLIGEKYLKMGGRVHFIGKPFPAVYMECLNALTKANGTPIHPSRICGIGDSLLHDIKGAKQALIGSIWTANGVHSTELGTSEGSPITPDIGILQSLM
eukprot:gene40908-54167_t